MPFSEGEMAKNNKVMDAKAKFPKSKESKVKGKKAGAAADGNTLKRSFESAKNNNKDVGPEDVTKGMQSGFITYVKFCCSSKNDSAATQASSILTKYKKLSPSDKKHLICNFFLRRPQSKTCMCIHSSP